MPPPGRVGRTKRYPVTLTRAAIADLRRIRERIGLDNPRAARRVAISIVTACDQLDAFPERGRPGFAPGTRELVSCRPNVIVYRLSFDRVEILRVWHGAQDREDER